MTLEVREIPPAPRRVRWSAVLWRRFGLLLGGGLLTVYGGILTVMFWIGDRSSYHQDAERALDAGAEQTQGLVLAIRTGENWRGDPQDVVRYEFVAPDGTRQEGDSFCAPGTSEVGAATTVEFVSNAPHKNRIVGGHVVFAAGLHAPTFWLTVAPGIALIWTWLVGVLSLRRVLRDGDAAIAQPLEVRRLGLMLPTMLEVRFRFRDHHAELREGRHWVLARSPLGERLSTSSDRPDGDSPRILWRPGQRKAAAPPTDWRSLRASELPRLVVVHDREQPQRYRLVAARDFEGAGAPPPTASPRAWLG